MDLKIGDKVRVLRNNCGAMHPTELRDIEPGEIVVIDDIEGSEEEDQVITYIVRRTRTFTNSIPMADVESAEGCTCDDFEMFWGGCKCGWFQKEKELKRGKTDSRTTNR